MCPQLSGSPKHASNSEAAIQELYQKMIAGWNERDASKMAVAFEQEGMIIGFDGTQHRGPEHIEQSLREIFQHHKTPPYITRVKKIRFLTADVAHLEAIAGMIPPQKQDLDPKLNALQSMIAVRKDGEWLIALFQNTPAQFHGRPEAVAAMTNELL